MMWDTLAARVAALALSQPDHPAVVFKRETLTYRQLADRAAAIGCKLMESGVARGDVVAFSAISRPEFAAVYLAVQRVGAVAVFLDKHGTPEHISRICREANAKLVLTDKPLGAHGEGLRVESLRGYCAGSVACADGCPAADVRGDDLAEILFTTGTTGRPKGVMLSRRAVHSILENTIKGTRIAQDTVMLLPLPLHHSFALRVLRAVLYTGGTVVLQNGFTFAREAENNIVDHRCNAMACVPASYEVMKSQMQDAFCPVMSRLRQIEFSAGSLSIRQRREITSMLPGVRVYNTWGSSESGGAIFCDVTGAVGRADRIDALGRPLPGRVQVRFLDEAAPLEELGWRQESLSNWFTTTDRAHPGRMALKGDFQMSGYWNDPETTAATLIDGWLITGDVAWQDADGDIFMLGRADDLINVGGEKVSPVEVEDAAGQHPSVRECACVGVDDPEGVLGQVPVLFVAAKPDWSEADLSRWLAARLERGKLPRRYIRVPELPRNRMQKVDREALKRMWREGGAQAPMNPVIEAILTRRSVRRFEDREIPPETLRPPSGHNLQSWRFTVLTRRGDIERLKSAAAEAAEARGVFMYGFENPRAMILVSNDVRNPDGCQDASCAAENIMLAAHSCGLGSVWINALMTLRDVEPVKAVLDDFGIPAGHAVWASIALGYPAAEPAKLEKNEGVARFL